MRVEKFGIDNGNVYLKLMKEGKGEEALVIPTVVSLYTGEANDLLEQSDISFEELENNIDVTINSKALKENGLRYIVGNKVLDDDLEAEEMEENSNKAYDDLTAIIGLTGMALKAIKSDYDNNHIDVTYDVGLSLPVNNLSVKIAEEYAERFIGVHEVIYHHPSGREQKVTIKIQYARTLPEGAAGTWGIIYNQDGSLKKWTIKDGDRDIVTDLEHAPILSYDIGGGTMEEVYTEGVVYKPKQSYGYDFGVKQTIAKVIKRWNFKYNPNELIDSISEFNEIYLNKENSRHNKLVKEAEIDLKNLAKRISKIMINKIDSLKTKPVVFVYGGGSVILEAHLRAELERKERLDRVIFLNDPLTVTAKGLMVYACSSRFEELKNTTLGVTSNGAQEN